MSPQDASRRPPAGAAGLGSGPAPGGLQQRLAESFEAALRIADGRAMALEMDHGKEHLFSSKFACPVCSYSLPELEPRLFSFNSPVGACPTCDGLGQVTVFDAERVVAFPSLSLASGAVKGWDRRNAYTLSMLESVARHYGFDIDTPFEQLPKEHQQVLLHGSGTTRSRSSTRPMARPAASARSSAGTRSKASSRTSSGATARPIRRRCARTWRATRPPSPAPTATARACGARRGMSSCRATTRRCAASRSMRVEHCTLAECLAYFEALHLVGAKAEIAEKVVREIRSRLKFLNDVGLNYLSLDRSADTLVGGEAQRIRLASQIGSGLTGVMYVLDEPSIGLHQRDNERLIGTLRHLRDLGNSVLVVEHDEDMIRSADHVVDMGPGAGVHGGRVIAQGTPDEVAANPESLTGRYLGGALRIAVPRAAPCAGRQYRPAAAGHRQCPRQQPARRRASRSRSACSPASPACRARARARWSTTRCMPRWRASSTRATPSRRRTMRSRASRPSTRSSTSTRARSAARRAATRPPTPACSRRSASCSPKCRRRASAATAPAASASTWPAAAAKPARATA